MLILLATQRLGAKVAVALYVLHNVLYAGFAFVAGWLADHLPKRPLLAAGYGLAAGMGLTLMFAPLNLPVLGAVFVMAGIYVATEEALEDSLAAELVDREHHGMGFGMLATVNGVGDFLSSVVVGALWTAFSPAVAFGYATVLFVAGAVVVWRLR
jgi:MFS family permease